MGKYKKIYLRRSINRGLKIIIYGLQKKNREVTLLHSNDKLKLCSFHFNAELYKKIKKERFTNGYKKTSTD